MSATRTLNIRQLQELIAGIGRLQNGAGRYLHLRDENHLVGVDVAMLLSEPMRDALRAGGFEDVITEGALPQDIADEFRRDGIDARSLDARLEEIADEITRRHPDTGAFYRTDANSQRLMDVWYLVHNLPDRLRPEGHAALRDLMEEVGGFSESESAEAARHFLRVEGVLTELGLSNAGNLRSMDNMEREVGTSGANTFFHYGAMHYTADDTDNTEETADDLDGRDAFSGYSISIVVNEREAHLLRTVPQADAPDFIFVAETGEAIDNRRGGDRTPSLREIMRSGDRALDGLPAQAGSTIQVVEGPSRFEQYITSPSVREALMTLRGEGATVGIDLGDQRPQEPVHDPRSHEPENRDLGAQRDNETEELEDASQSGGDSGTGTGGRRRMPWGNLIGAGIGAWLTSAMGGGGIGQMFAMLIGGLIGWVMGGAIGGNHGHPFMGAFDQEEEPETDTPENEDELAVASLVATEHARALAFQNVSSVTAPLEVISANRGELLDAPQNFVVPTIAEIAPTLH